MTPTMTRTFALALALALFSWLCALLADGLPPILSDWTIAAMKTSGYLSVFLGVGATLWMIFRGIVVDE